MKTFQELFSAKLQIPYSFTLHTKINVGPFEEQVIHVTLEDLLRAKAKFVSLLQHKLDVDDLALLERDSAEKLTESDDLLDEHLVLESIIARFPNDVSKLSFTETADIEDDLKGVKRGLERSRQFLLELVDQKSTPGENDKWAEKILAVSKTILTKAGQEKFPESEIYIHGLTESQRFITEWKECAQVFSQALSALNNLGKVLNIDLAGRDRSDS